MLRGDLDAVVVGRVRLHLEHLLAAGIDDITVDSWHPSLLDVLGQAQRRLGRTRHVLRIRGPGSTPLTAPSSDPDSAPR